MQSKQECQASETQALVPCIKVKRRREFVLSDGNLDEEKKKKALSVRFFVDDVERVLTSSWPSGGVRHGNVKALLS